MSLILKSKNIKKGRLNLSVVGCSPWPNISILNLPEQHQQVYQLSSGSDNGAMVSFGLNEAEKCEADKAEPILPHVIPVGSYVSNQRPTRQLRFCRRPLPSIAATITGVNAHLRKTPSACFACVQKCSDAFISTATYAARIALANFMTCPPRPHRRTDCCLARAGRTSCFRPSRDHRGGLARSTWVVRRPTRLRSSRRCRMHSKSGRTDSGSEID